MPGHSNVSFSSWAIRNPIPPIVLFLVLTVAGLFAYVRLPVNNMPAIVIPMVEVQVSLPGATATGMEAQVTRKVESALAGLQGVKHVTSTITEGASTSFVEFLVDTDFDRAVNDARDAVAGIRVQLPQSVSEPQVQRVTMDGGAILIYTLQAPEMRPEEASWFIDDVLTRELMGVRGVASVQRQGGVDLEVTVTPDPAKLTALGISAAEISRALAQTNVDVPGGRITLSGTEYALRTLGNVKDVKSLKEIRIPIASGLDVRLGDLGTIADGGAEARNITKLDGEPAITFQIFRSKGASEIEVARHVAAKLAEIEKAHDDVRFRQIFSLVTFTEDSFHATLSNFVEGAALTILVVFLFLRDRRATLIAAIAIPLSIIPTFLVMHGLGFSLNTVSLLAISLVTGVLVDDAIVEIENIHRHMREGRPPYDAAMIAADEIGLAVIATTLVICAVFIPVSFMPGLSGQLFLQFGLTVGIAAFFSLIVARLLTPMLAAYLLKAPQHRDQITGAWSSRYRRLVDWTLDHRLETMGLALLSMALSFAMIPFLSPGFIPYEDYSQSRLTLELPRGATLEQVDEAAHRAAAILKTFPEVEHILTRIGGNATSMGGGPGGPDAANANGINVATLDVKLVPPDKRTLDQRAFEARILPELRTLPDMRINVQNSSGEKDVSILLVSENTAALVRTAEALEREMRAIPGLSSVSTTTGLPQPEITITPDFTKAAQLGISVQAIGDAINISTIGDAEVNLAKFNYGDRKIPIRVRLPKTSNQTLDTLKNLKLPTSKGGSVPLSAIANITFGSGPTTIHRYDLQRQITLEANLDGIALGTALEQIHALAAMRDMPSDINILDSGDAERMAELFSSFGQALGAGLLMVYAIQVLLYKDWIQPLTRMAALPLSIGGAFIMLLITGTDFSMPALIGILMLMGIADKNSILLVDHMLELLKQGRSRREAIVEACMVRARPILMTSFAMLAGMLPIVLQLGLDTAFRAPMAIAVMGGLISSTALSLVFVPVMFSYVRDFEDWLRPKAKRIIS
ncbi:MAG: acriflavin resistance protein [Stygiobacter sp.]|nr:MAG: acriflavin resistance protein [Stygiobacter sp.]